MDIKKDLTSIISIGNKLDNRLQNLVYLTHAEHLSLHKIGNKNCLGKKLNPLSEQTKTKLSDTHKKKQVYCLELDKVFAGVKIAARELSLSAGHISSCCQGKLKTTGGYHWQYIEVKNEEV